MAMSLPGFEISRVTVNGLNYLNFCLSHSSYDENKLLLPLLIFQFVSFDNIVYPCFSCDLSRRIT